MSVMAPEAGDIEAVLVSNRGPVSFEARSDGSFGTERGAGGLAGALDPVARELGDAATWIAAATSEDDRKAIVAGVLDDMPEKLGYELRLLDIDDRTYTRYYNDVANRMLWFAMHCLFEELDVHEFGRQELAAWDEAYEPVNQRFAEAAAEAAGPEAFVLIQDYHLTTAPQRLRAARPEQTILHFTHSSFCGPQGLDMLPGPIPKTIVQGMLGADLVGFHVSPWARAFLDACERIGANVDRDKGLVEHDGRRSWVRAYPIPVHPDELQERARGDSARAWADRFLEGINGPLVVRADRSEPSKNIVRGFEAFGLLLDRRRDLRDARFVACLYPSRQEVPEYRRYMQQIHESVMQVNHRHPGSISLIMENDYDRTLGALLVYDVLLVNSIMDGMNLVSKEGAIVNERDGALVLSRLAGSFDELGDHSIELDDPLSVEQTSNALQAAIDMPQAERSQNAEALKRAVRASRPEGWIEAQLEDLAEIKAGQEPKSAAPSPEQGG
ncbi:trehalose-6-phosphate synthase [soil metagenome]